jgi:hypothetical protein
MCSGTYPFWFVFHSLPYNTAYIPLHFPLTMKRTLFSLLLTVAIATTASAQAGWGSSDSWDAPKKSPAKKKTTTTSGQTRAAGNQATPQNDGRTVSPYPSAPGQADPNPGNTVSTPPDNSFVPGTTSSSTQGGNDRQGMSAAPGTPVMLQSGRSVMANDAAAARERRLRRDSRSKAAAAQPTLVGTEGTISNGGNQATGAGAAGTGATGAGMGAAGSGTGTTGAAIDANSGAGVRPAGQEATTAPKPSATPKAVPAKKPVKKAPAAPGW